MAARIDIAGYIEALVRSELPANVAKELPHLQEQLVPLIDQRFAAAVQGMINGMNGAVWGGIPDDGRVAMGDPVVGPGASRSR